MDGNLPSGRDCRGAYLGTYLPRNLLNTTPTAPPTQYLEVPVREPTLSRCGLEHTCEKIKPTTTVSSSHEEHNDVDKNTSRCADVRQRRGNLGPHLLSPRDLVHLVDNQSPKYPLLVLRAMGAFLLLSTHPNCIAPHLSLWRACCHARCEAVRGRRLVCHLGNPPASLVVCVNITAGGCVPEQSPCLDELFLQVKGDGIPDQQLADQGNCAFAAPVKPAHAGAVGEKVWPECLPQLCFLIGAIVLANLGPFGGGQHDVAQGAFATYSLQYLKSFHGGAAESLALALEGMQIHDPCQRNAESVCQGQDPGDLFENVSVGPSGVVKARGVDD